MTDRPTSHRLQTTGRILIGIGVAVWVVYGIVRMAGADPGVGWFLPMHLLGVIPGAILSRWETIRRWLGRDPAV